MTQGDTPVIALEDRPAEVRRPEEGDSVPCETDCPAGWRRLEDPGRSLVGHTEGAASVPGLVGIGIPVRQTREEVARQSVGRETSVCRSDRRCDMRRSLFVLAILGVLLIGCGGEIEEVGAERATATEDEVSPEVQTLVSESAAPRLPEEPDRPAGPSARCDREALREAIRAACRDPRPKACPPDSGLECAELQSRADANERCYSAREDYITQCPGPEDPARRGQEVAAKRARDQWEACMEELSLECG